MSCRDFFAVGPCVCLVGSVCWRLANDSASSVFLSFVFDVLYVCIFVSCVFFETNRLPRRNGIFITNGSLFCVRVVIVVVAALCEH